MLETITYLNTWEMIIKRYLIDTEDISEILANGSVNLYGKQRGKSVCFENIFTSEEMYTQSVKDELIPLLNIQGNTDYLVEGKLTLPNKGLARVHIVMSPASNTPLVTIAKKSTLITNLNHLVENKTISVRMKNFLKAVVDCELTLVISGGTGSGKTTFLETLTKEIAPNVRIGVVEDSQELQLLQENCVYLHSTPYKPSMDKNCEVTLYWLVQQVNRMRVDRLIIGETRGKEFKSFLTASNSGLNGSMTTIHANNPKMALQKMTQFVMESQPQQARVINRAIANSIDLIIQLEGLPNGTYKCTSIEEISNTFGNDESAEFATSTLASWNTQTSDWNESFMLSTKLRQQLMSKGYDTHSFAKRTQRINGLPTLCGKINSEETDL